MEISSQPDYLLLQSKLNIFCDWVQCIKVSLNLNKCIRMYFCRSRLPLIHPYYIDGISLERVPNIIDLGFHLMSILE